MPETTVLDRSATRWMHTHQRVTAQHAVHAGDVWTSQQLRELERLLDADTTMTEIALAMGRTYQAVTARVHVLRGTREERTLKLGQLCPNCYTTASLTGECLC